MRANRPNVLLGIFAAGWLLFSCNDSSNNPPAESPTLSDLWISAGQIPGWTLDTNYRFLEDLPVDTLYNAIDGGAESYKTNGLVDFNFETLSGSSPRQTDLLISDFGTDAKARAFYDIRKYPDSLPGYPASTATYTNLLGGISTVFCKNKFVVELQFSGYDNLDSARSDALVFCRYFDSKI